MTMKDVGSPTGTRPRIVAAFPRRPCAPAHETASQCALSGKLAGVLGAEFLEDYEPVRRPEFAGVYYVPSRTLVHEGAQAEARPSDVASPDDLFGGVVPHAFVATKAISHPLVEPGACAPPGWTHAFGERVRQAVLRGVTVFSAADALRAGELLLREGPVRIKPVLGTGGRGQSVAHDAAALKSAVEGLDREELARCGLVLEENLEQVETYSVGQARVAGLLTSYVGTQSLTRDHAGQMVYGGSELHFARGGYEALLGLRIDDAQRQAVQLARRYDEAAGSCFPALYASRRNYDVARGRNAAGQPRAGVLEQSWRAGGASFAEACALEALRADPRLRSLTAFTCERYARDAALPRGAQLVYRGDDPEAGFILKYGGISSYGDT